ncbi:MAG: hypothetical protein ACXWE3_09490 [Methylobacter sp.]
MNNTYQINNNFSDTNEKWLKLCEDSRKARQEEHLKSTMIIPRIDSSLEAETALEAYENAESKVEEIENQKNKFREKYF